MERKGYGEDTGDEMSICSGMWVTDLLYWEEGGKASVVTWGAREE